MASRTARIIADAKKASALSVHRALILRDGKPSMVYSDEVQFFEDPKKTHLARVDPQRYV